MTDDTCAYWIEKIQKEEKAHEKWRKAAEKAEDDYFDQRSDGKQHLFNLFHSTVNTLHARLYSRVPTPDVRRRFDMEGPIAQAAKEAATLIERGLSYTLDTSAFHANADRAVLDFLVAGAGVPWIEYEAKVTEGPMGPQIALQRLHLKHVPWKRFHWEPGKDWEDVDWVARDHYLTKREIQEQYPEAKLSEAGSGGGRDTRERQDQDKYATTFRVTEIYFRPKRTVYVIGWDFDEPLEVRQDALGLEDFFPCPRPMFANVKSRELCPTPDHHFNAPAYEYVNRLVQRIHSLTQQIKDAGFYDASMTELSALQSATDGTLVPVSNLTERLASTGSADFSKTIATLPMAEKVTVVRELQQLLVSEKQRLDEINGIADIVRGSTDPRETAKAQSIKDNWANLRLARKTGEVSRCLRDCFRIMAEIMAEHFTPQTLYMMTGMQPSPEALQVLKSDLSRALAIDVETDSTVAIEDEAEKQQRIEFLNYVTPFLQNMLPAIQQGMLPADVGKELLKFALQTFKHGRALEDAIDAAPDTMAQLSQMQQQLQEAQMQAQQMGEQMQKMQQQLAQADQAKQQADAMKGQAGLVKAQTDQFKAQVGAVQAERDTELEAFKAQTDRIATLKPDTHNINVM